MDNSSIPLVVQVMPLNDDEVIQYLDAHPDILHRYLTERAGLAESLLRAHAPPPPPDNNNVASTFQENNDVVVEDNCASLLGRHVSVDSVSDLFPLFEFGDEQTSINMEEETNDIDDGLWEADYDIDDDDNLFGGDGSDELDHWASPDTNSSHASEGSLGDIETLEAGESQYDLQASQPDSSQEGTASNQHSSSPSQSGFPSTASTPMPMPMPIPTEPQPSVPQNTTSLPYPAPERLVAASRSEPKGKKWRLFEEESCIRHMLSIRDEGILHGEDRFREAQRRMAHVDGIQKDAKYAVKNFWNRVGRARSGFDERKNQKAPLATSQQGKTARASSSVSSATPRKRKNVSKATKTKRKYESDSEDDTPFDPKEECNPPLKKRNRDDDSDDEWQPDQNAFNAIAVRDRPCSGAA
ncbi:hypothetical protein LTS17_010792 [Exophiala oligosperma]